MRRAIVAAIVAVLAALAINCAMVTWPAWHAAAQDPRNSNVKLYSYFRWGVDPFSLVIDIWSISNSAAMVDVDRALFDIAEGLKGRTYTTVYLAFRGRPRFQMKGDYFKQIGVEREWQNPVYVIRTMSEHIMDMNGRPAFGTWTGGWLGVLNKQMEDHAEFHRRWYMLDM